MARTHKAILIAETKVNIKGIQDMLDYLGVSDWTSDTPNDHDLLVEIAGRLCYKSFGVGLNPNITRVREGNMNYIGNSILNQKHGSVLEHPSVTFALLNVSRILTHELVRHRIASYSQESQRFVRLDTFEMYIPDLTDAFVELHNHLAPKRSPNIQQRWVDHMQAKFLSTMEYVKEVTQDQLKDMIAELGLDEEGVPFTVKKQITSAMRRFIPGGVNTHIITTVNHRTLRHEIEMRTAKGAEIEIAEVFNDIAQQVSTRYPGIYQDIKADPYNVNDPNTLYAWSFGNNKI